MGGIAVKMREDDPEIWIAMSDLKLDGSLRGIYLLRHGIFRSGLTTESLKNVNYVFVKWMFIITYFALTSLLLAAST